jgi:hypothetical protein
MADKSNLDLVNREKRKAELTALSKAKKRIRIINYVLGRAEDKLGSMIMDGLPGPRELESLDYDLSALRILWHKHLAWLKTLGLRGVGSEDRTKVRDCFDQEDDGNYPADILEG